MANNHQTMTFLGCEEIEALTGRKFKRLQIEALKSMGIPFWINAAGKPIVVRTAVVGHHSLPTTATATSWSPKLRG
jgi:hypothetical protein